MRGLPVQLEVGGRMCSIRTDYRDCITILEAFGDAELSTEEKWEVCLEILYMDFNTIREEDYQEAVEKAVWFLNCGGAVKEVKQKKPVMDWEQDEHVLFSAINKVAGMETRSARYIHFWTFIGYFNEIGEGLFSTIINIRSKKNKGKKLDKAEQAFYRENKNLVDLNVVHPEREQQEIDFLNNLLG